MTGKSIFNTARWELKRLHISSFDYVETDDPEVIHFNTRIGSIHIVIWADFGHIHLQDTRLAMNAPLIAAHAYSRRIRPLKFFIVFEPKSLNKYRIYSIKRPQRLF